jgi:hypothetical protein
VPNPFDMILIMCGATGVIMVVGSILLLYQGVIKLGEKAAESALEAQFKDQIRVNIRNPALGLFAIGFSFFVLALYFARPQEGSPVVLSGHIKIADVGGIIVRLKSDEWPITVSSEGEIFTTVQPLEKLEVVIDAPGYRPPRWVHQIRPDEARNGHVQIATPEFTPATGLLLSRPFGGPN